MVLQDRTGFHLSTTSSFLSYFLPSIVTLSTSFTTLSSPRGRRLFLHAASRELTAIRLAARQFLIRHVSCWSTARVEAIGLWGDRIP